MRLRLITLSSIVLLAPLLTVLPAAASTGPVAAKAAVAAPQAAIHAAAAPATPAPVRTKSYDGGVMGKSKATASPSQFSAAVIGNVTGHTDGDTDVVAGYVDGTIHVWDQRTGRQEFVVQTGGAVQSSPALVRTRVGGGLLVLTSNTSGDVLIYNFAHGQIATVFHKHVAPVGHPGLNGFFGTPTMADLDNNGKFWIIATSWDQHLYVWDLGGNNKPGFPFFAQDTIWSSPTVATFPGDPYPRIVFGYDCIGAKGQACFAKWHTHGGVLTVLQHNGKVAPGFPVFITGQVVWSTPAVASLYGTSAKQIVVGTGQYWPNAGRQTWVFDAAGHRLKVVPMSGRTFSSPAIGDVMGTGKAQIVIGTEDGFTDIIDSNWHRLAHVCTSSSGKCVTTASSPIIGDLYGNGQQEIVAVGGNQFFIIDHTGQKTATVQIPETVLGLSASPTLVNIAGKATLYFSVMTYGPGGTHASVYAYTFNNAAGPSAWPMFKGDYARSGSPAKAVPLPAA